MKKILLWMVGHNGWLWNGLLEVKGGVQYRQGLLSEDC